MIVIWIAAIVVFGIVEAVTVGLVSIWFVLGAVAGLLAAVLGACGYAANARQNSMVLAVIKHGFTTIPGVLWVITAAVLFFYRLNRRAYNQIVREIRERETV